MFFSSYLKNFFISLIFLCLMFEFSWAKDLITPAQGKNLINSLGEKKNSFLIEISRKEDECLKLFFSGNCLENLLIEHDKGIREFEIKKQIILKRVRIYESKLRKKRRENKIKNSR